MQDRSLNRWVNQPPARNRCHERCDIGIPWPSLFYSRTIASPFSRFLDMRTSCVFEHCLSNWDGFLIGPCYVLILAQNSRISSLLSTNSMLVVENYFCRPGSSRGCIPVLLSKTWLLARKPDLGCASGASIVYMLISLGTCYNGLYLQTGWSKW